MMFCLVASLFFLLFHSSYVASPFDCMSIRSRFSTFCINWPVVCLWRVRQNVMQKQQQRWSHWLLSGYILYFVFLELFTLVLMEIMMQWYDTTVAAYRWSTFLIWMNKFSNIYIKFSSTNCYFEQDSNMFSIYWLELVVG